MTRGLEAAAGTPGPGSSTGSGGGCNTNSGGKRHTGLGTTSQSAAPWPTPAFATDSTVNTTSSARGFSGAVVGLPAVPLYGGSGIGGIRAGVLTLHMRALPPGFIFR